MAKRLGNHSDDGVGGVVEFDGLTQNVFAPAEISLPEIVTDNHHMGTARLVFFSGEIPAPHRLQAQNIEEVGADACGRKNLRRLAGGRDARRTARGRTQSFENIAAVFAPLPDRFFRQIQRVTARAIFIEGLVNPDETIRFREGQRAQQRAFNDRKDGGVRADSEREGGDGDEAEGRRFTKRA